MNIAHINTDSAIKHIFEKLIENSAIKLIISGAGSIITFLFGGFESIIIAFVALLCLDYLTGIAKGIKNKNLSSYLSRQGYKKLLNYFLLLIFAALIERSGVPALSFAILWISLTEAISVAENFEELGVYVPPFIREILLKTKEKKFGE